MAGSGLRAALGRWAAAGRPDRAAVDVDALTRAEAMAAAQTRRADAAEAALRAVHDRLQALEAELYVARSAEQRAAVRIEELQAKLARASAHQ